MDIAGGMTDACEFKHTGISGEIEARLRQELVLTYDLFCIVEEGGVLGFIGDSVHDILGYAKEEIEGESVIGLLHPDEVDHLLTTLASLYGAEGKKRASEVARLRSKSGEWLSFELMGCGFDPESGGAIIAARSLADRRVPDRMMAVDNVLFRRLATLSGDMTLLIDRNDHSVYVSSSVSSVLGLTPAEVLEMPIEELFVEADRDQVNATLLACRENDGEPSRVEVRARSFDDSPRWVEATIVNLLSDPTVAGIAVHLRDIHERRLTEELLRFRANHDPLTGLPNRYWFVDRLERSAALGRVDTAVIFCDLDRFKVINDHYGHRVGDEILREVARRLRATVRPGDSSARIGGDEFCVVCDRLSSVREALEIAERIRSAVAQPAVIDGQQIEIGVSIGVAWSGDSAEPVDTDTLLAVADRAMYVAKSTGRNRVEFAAA
jgi:diguanylate cyclase (GGDEF)-like protein/PAS domain S-box-containing protein